MRLFLARRRRAAMPYSMMEDAMSMLPERARAVLGLIGRTPMVSLQFEPEGLTLLAKCEFLNPSGSIKDRFAKGVLTDALQKGMLKPGGTIVECSSGNTGIAMSMIGAALGFK